MLRQLKHVDGEDVFVRVIWPSRARDLVCPLTVLKEDPKFAFQQNDQPPRAFEVFSVRDDGRRFSGRKTFIEELEQAVPSFYDQIGQHLERWRPKPPKPVQDREEERGPEALEADQSKPERMPVEPTREPARTATASPGNRHTDLLDIPDFLQRFAR